MKKATGEIENPKSKIQNWAVVVFLLWGAGCGYRFSGTEKGLPADVRAVFVESFVNSSPDVGIESEITLALKSEFRRQGRLRVVDRIEQADAVLSGVVRAFESHVLSANRRDEALQYEVALVVDMSLRRRVSNELLWRAQGTRLAEIYSGSRGAVVTSSSDFARGTLNSTDVRRLTDVQLTETSSQEARGRLIDRLARELHQRILELF